MGLSKKQVGAQWGASDLRDSCRDVTPPSIRGHRVALHLPRSNSARPPPNRILLCLIESIDPVFCSPITGGVTTMPSLPPPPPHPPPHGERVAPSLRTPPDAPFLFGCYARNGDQLADITESDNGQPCLNTWIYK